jgi:putative membrane protein insertion efficiency factor
MLRLLIRGYQFLISPVLTLIVGPGCGCRFEPTCSQYLLEAVETHGALRGGWLGLRRLGRCHPWGGSGFDPVPSASSCRGPGVPAAGKCRVKTLI